MDDSYFRKNRRGSLHGDDQPKKDDFFDSIDMDDDFSGKGPDPDDFSGKGPDLEDFSADVPDPDDFSGDGPDLEEIEAREAAGTGGKNTAEERRGGGRRRTVRELNTAATTLDTGKIKSEKEKKKKSTIRKIIGMVILELLTLACIFTYGYFLRAWNLISRPEVDESVIENKNISLKKIQEMEEGYWTIAVFGVDGRSASDLVSKGLNSDVIIIVNISQATGEIRMCSVFRDTYLNISDSDSYRKINAAYANGGPEQALAALNKNLDLNIKHYVTFNWKAVADGINILGGIDDIDISKAELYYINAFITETVEVTKIGSYQLKSTGPQHLDGVQAVAYGRLRLMDSDFARTERQKRVIKAAFEKAKQSSFSVLNNIMVVCFPEVATNINFNTVVAMAQDITKYSIGATGGFPWQRSASAIASVGDVVVPATLESNVRKLHEFLFDDTGYEPSDAVKRYSATISEKTGIYKEGQVVESVRTDGGLISRPKTQAAEESHADDAGENSETVENETDADGNEVVRATIGVDEYGSYVYPTNENGQAYVPVDRRGNPVYPTDEYGNIIYETDPAGNVINPTNADGSPWTMPETDPEETEEHESMTGESSHGNDREPADGPGGNSATRPYDGPGSSTTAPTTEGYGPGNPEPSASASESSGHSQAETTAHPNETVGGDRTPGGSDVPGGSTNPGSSSESGTESAAGGSTPGGSSVPGGADAPGGSSNAPGGNSTPGGSSGGNTSGNGPVTGTQAPGAIAPGGIDGPG